MINVSMLINCCVSFLFPCQDLNPVGNLLFLNERKVTELRDVVFVY